MRKHFMITVSVALSIILLSNPLLIGASGKRGSVSPAKKLEPVSSPKSNRPLKPTRPRPIVEEGQTSTLLPNGSWLLLGGQGANGPKNTAVVRDSFSGQSQELREKLNTPRAWHSATMLPDAGWKIRFASRWMRLANRAQEVMRSWQSFPKCCLSRRCDAMSPLCRWRRQAGWREHAI